MLFFNTKFLDDVLIFSKEAKPSGSSDCDVQGFELGPYSFLFQEELLMSSCLVLHRLDTIGIMHPVS